MNGKLTYTNTGEATINGLYITDGYEFNFYAKSRPLFKDIVTNDITVSLYGKEKTIYHKIYDKYNFLLFATEAQAKQLLMLKTSKDVKFTYVDEAETYTADTSISENFNISVSDVEKSSFLRIDLTFLVYKGTVNNSFIDTNNFRLILTNKDYRTNAFKAPYSDFLTDSNTLHYIEHFLPYSYEKAESLRENDVIDTEYRNLSVRNTVKQKLKTYILGNNAIIDLINKNLGLCNSIGIEDQTTVKNLVLVSNLAFDTVTDVVTDNSASGKLKDLVCGQKILFDNGNIYTVKDILTDNSISVYETLLDESANTNLQTYDFYLFSELPEISYSKLIDNFNLLEVTGIYDILTNYILA